MNRIKLGDIAVLKTGPFGTQLSAKEYTENGIPIINVKNIGYGDILTDELDYVSEDTCERLNEHILEEGDIVFGRKGSVDRHAYIDKQFSGWLQGSDCIRVRCIDNVNKKFISHYLKLEHIKKQVNHAAVGSTMASLNTDILKRIEIDLPDRMYQDAIENILTLIEEKIVLNKKINDNLSVMAYDTYMHTFYGKKPNGKLSDILVENDKSKVQVGEAKESDGEYPFFTSGEAILRWKEHFVDGRNCFLNTGGNADVKFYVGKAAYSTDTWCISANQNLGDYLYLLLLSIKPELNKKFFQGTGLKHLQKPLLKDRPIYIPTTDEITTFNSQIPHWFDIIAENTRENQHLTALRDWLLPMLMNGQATISE